MRGRDFSRAGADAEEMAVIVNERFAALHFPDAEPIGQRLSVTATAAAGAPQWRTVVGVVPDIRHRLDQPSAIAIVYTPSPRCRAGHGDIVRTGCERRGIADRRCARIAAATRWPGAARPRALAPARDPRRDMVQGRVGHARLDGVRVGVRPGGGRALRRGLAPHGAPAARDRPAYGARRQRPRHRPAGGGHGRRRGGARPGAGTARRRRLGPGVRSRTRGARLSPGSLAAAAAALVHHGGARLPAAGRPARPGSPPETRFGGSGRRAVNAGRMHRMRRWARAGWPALCLAIVASGAFASAAAAD